MAEKFDALFILAGSFQPAIGNMAQLFHRLHPEAPIMLTPWASSPAILEIAGPAVSRIILPGLYPSRHSDSAIGAYFRRFQNRFGYQPHAMTIGVRQAVELLEHAFADGRRTPEEVKKYLLSVPTHQTSLGPISFDQYGDVAGNFIFVDEVDKELK
jgi:ABC-type branched-subunit amino acid transport system substrate-binding protein